jgi:hypothetical protein
VALRASVLNDQGPDRIAAATCLPSRFHALKDTQYPPILGGGADTQYRFLSPITPSVFWERRESDPSPGFRGKTLKRKREAEVSAEPVDFADLWAPTDKPCSKCGRWLPLGDFPVNRRMHFGRGSRCRQCAREATADWRRRNRYRENAARRARYRAEHPLRSGHVLSVAGCSQGGGMLVCCERCRNQRKRLSKRRAQERGPDGR